MNWTEYANRICNIITQCARADAKRTEQNTKTENEIPKQSAPQQMLNRLNITHISTKCTRADAKRTEQNTRREHVISQHSAPEQMPNKLNRTREQNQRYLNTVLQSRCWMNWTELANRTCIILSQCARAVLKELMRIQVQKVLHTSISHFVHLSICLFVSPLVHRTS